MLLVDFHLCCIEIHQSNSCRCRIQWRVQSGDVTRCFLPLESWTGPQECWTSEAEMSFHCTLHLKEQIVSVAALVLKRAVKFELHAVGYLAQEYCTPSSSQGHKERCRLFGCSSHTCIPVHSFGLWREMGHGCRNSPALSKGPMAGPDEVTHNLQVKEWK